MIKNDCNLIVNNFWPNHKLVPAKLIGLCVTLF